MTNFFSDAGQRALHDFVMPGMLCLFDFDGTLSPLVDQPAAAVLPQPVQQRLHRLQRSAQVGIVTGRSLADIGARLEFVPDYLIGNHGLEGLPGWQQRAAEFDHICSAWRADLATALSGMDAGIHLEDKRYSLSLHYRHAHDPAHAMQQLPVLFSQLSPAPRVIPGKCVFSLLPPSAIDKGQAVTQLIAQTGVARTLYVGDDVTDEDVFALRRKDLLSVRVVFDPHSAAQFFIPERAAIEDLLDRLVLCLQAPPIRQTGQS